MAKTPLKTVGPQPSPPMAARVDTAALRQVVAEARHNTPPAVVAGRSRQVLINIKVEPELADALAELSSKAGISQKLFIMRALAAAGAPVGQRDLEDRTPRRRRAA